MMLRYVCLFVIAIALAGCQNNPVNSEPEKINRQENEIVRDYLSAVKILWTSGEEVINAERLLKSGTGQADLVGADLCTMNGNAESPTSLLLDFGKEIHGGIEIVTGMFKVNKPIRIRSG